MLGLLADLGGDRRADGGELLFARGQQHDIHHTAVILVVLAVDIASLVQAIDQRRDVRLGDAQAPGDLGNGHRAHILEHGEDLHMGQGRAVFALNGVHMK